jgi:methionyl-tRNA formyltransferase
MKRLVNPTPQIEEEATFTRMLGKDDKIIDPKQFSASQLYNRWRAFLLFPGTAFKDDYFKSSVRIDECSPYQKRGNEKILFESKNWIELNLENKKIVCLLCTQSTLLQVFRITLESGKTVDFKGFEFEN